jgi:pimeloyl-ACP methyl ester carboxylesterase
VKTLAGEFCRVPVMLIGTGDTHQIRRPLPFAAQWLLPTMGYWHKIKIRDTEDDIRKLRHRALIVHGREDQVIPLQTSLRLTELTDNADLSVFSHCGHSGPMIEHTADFSD